MSLECFLKPWKMRQNNELHTDLASFLFNCARKNAFFGFVQKCYFCFWFVLKYRVVFLTGSAQKVLSMELVPPNSKKKTRPGLFKPASFEVGALKTAAAAGSRSSTEESRSTTIWFKALLQRLRSSRPPTSAGPCSTPSSKSHPCTAKL